MVLTGKEQIHSLNQWDKFDEVTDAIYTLSNPLYIAQLERDSLRFSGIAKDPYFYVGEEYARHYAPDDFRIYPTQTSMFNANNLMTALGQVRCDAFSLVGPRERGLAVRADDDFETDLLDRMYENPDLNAQMEYTINFEDNINDVNNVAKAMNKTASVVMQNRWTTQTSSYDGQDDTKVNLALLRMEMKM